MVTAAIMASSASGSRSNGPASESSFVRQTAFESSVSTHAATPTANSSLCYLLNRTNSPAPTPIPRLPPQWTILRPEFPIQNSSRTLENLEQANAWTVIYDHSIVNPSLQAVFIPPWRLLPPPSTELSTSKACADVENSLRICYWAEGFNNQIFQESSRRKPKIPLIKKRYIFRGTEAARHIRQTLQLPLLNKFAEMAFMNTFGLKEVEDQLVVDNTRPPSVAFLKDATDFLGARHIISYSEKRAEDLRKFVNADGVKDFLVQCHTNMMRQRLHEEQKHIPPHMRSFKTSGFETMTHDELKLKYGERTERNAQLELQNSLLDASYNESGNSSGIGEQTIGVLNESSSNNGSSFTDTSVSKWVRPEETSVLQTVEELSREDHKIESNPTQKKKKKRTQKNKKKKEEEKNQACSPDSNSEPPVEFKVIDDTITASNSTNPVPKGTPASSSSGIAIGTVPSSYSDDFSTENKQFSGTNETPNVGQAQGPTEEDDQVERLGPNTSHFTDGHSSVHGEFDSPQASLSIPERSYHEKSKSMSAAEFVVNTPSTITEVIERLKHDRAPLTRDESQRRRASIKQERRDSICLIRTRTQSRTSSRGLPEFPNTPSPASNSEMMFDTGESSSDPHIHAHPQVEEMYKNDIRSGTDGLMTSSDSPSVTLENYNVQENKNSSTASDPASYSFKDNVLLSSAICRASKAAPLPETQDGNKDGGLHHSKTKKKSKSKSKSKPKSEYKDHHVKSMNQVTINSLDTLETQSVRHRQNSVFKPVSVASTLACVMQDVALNSVQDGSKRQSQKLPSKDIVRQPEPSDAPDPSNEFVTDQDKKVGGSRASVSTSHDHSKNVEGQKDIKMVSSDSVASIFNGVSNSKFHGESDGYEAVAPIPKPISIEGQKPITIVRYKTPPVVSSQTLSVYDPAIEPRVSKKKPTDAESSLIYGECCDSDYEDKIGPHLSVKRKEYINIIPIDHFMQTPEQPQKSPKKPAGPATSDSNVPLSQNSLSSSSQASTPDVVSESMTDTPGYGGLDNVIARPGPLPADIEQHTTSNGRVYYWNRNTNTSSWDDPRRSAYVPANNPASFNVLDHPEVNKCLQPGFTFKCEKCGVTTSDTDTAKPAVICFGCGPSSAIRYCSTACLLADSMDHGLQHCGQYGGEWPMAWGQTPYHWLQLVPALRPLVQISKECFRQMTYFMRAHDGMISNPVLAVWNTLSDADRARAVTDHSGDPEHLAPADYFIFHPATQDTTEVDELEVMLHVDFKKGYMEQMFFHRALNAAFLTRDAIYVEFIYRMLLDFFSKGEPNHQVSANYLAKCKDVMDAQILAEFDWDPATSTKKDEEFGAIVEYQIIEASIYALELQHPSIRAWVRNNSNFPQCHRARLAGEGWHSTPTTHLVPGNIMDFGPGWSGMGEAQWQFEIRMLQTGQYSYQGRGYPEPVRRGD